MTEVWKDLSAEKRAIETLMDEMYQISSSKGFWDTERNEGEAIALMHSELSEALEAARHGNPQSEKIPEFSQIEEEFADAVIRILEWCEGKGYNLSGAILAKAAYNRKRPPMHGKSF